MVVRVGTGYIDSNSRVYMLLGLRRPTSDPAACKYGGLSLLLGHLILSLGMICKSAW